MIVDTLKTSKEPVDHWLRIPVVYRIRVLSIDFKYTGKKFNGWSKVSLKIFLWRFVLLKCYLMCNNLLLKVFKLRLIQLKNVDWNLSCWNLFEWNDLFVVEVDLLRVWIWMEFLNIYIHTYVSGICIFNIVFKISTMRCWFGSVENM